MSHGQTGQPSTEISAASGTGDPPWWQSFFDETYAEFGLVVPEQDRQGLDRLVEFLIGALGLTAGQVLFDQCCGIGRLSLPIARRGIRVIGVDQVSSYVERARDATAREGLAGEFHCGNARGFVTPEPCDAAINWFTSIGYDDDDAVNIKMFERAFESLRPGGRYAIDYLNIPRICTAFQRRIFHRSEPDADLIVLMESTPDLRRGMIDSVWTFLYPDGRREDRRVATRMHMPHELVGLLRRSGFGPVQLYGSPDGEPYELESPRCILVAARESNHLMSHVDR